MLSRTVLFLSLLCGCAPAYSPPPVTPDHPASPLAAEAPAPEASTALAGAVIPEAPAGVVRRHHDGHRHHGDHR